LGRGDVAHHPVPEPHGGGIVVVADLELVGLLEREEIVLDEGGSVHRHLHRTKDHELPFGNPAEREHLMGRPIGHEVLDQGLPLVARHELEGDAVGGKGDGPRGLKQEVVRSLEPKALWHRHVEAKGGG